MGVEVTSKILVGIDPSQSGCTEDELEELKCLQNYGIIGSYWTGDEDVIGYEVTIGEIAAVDWQERFQEIKKMVAEDLKCNIDIVDLHHGELYH